jgi:predicted transcriptional regulator of viral defense system
MKLKELNNIKKLYFGYEEIARVLGISGASAKVTASRYVRQGLLVRVKRNMYVLQENWKQAGRDEKYILANLGQTPSYISLMTALDYYEITSQMQRDYIESIAVKRSKEARVNGSVFRYTKIKNNLYFGFKKTKSFFIATPEKALLDALYLISYGRYAIDIAALDFDKLDKAELKRISNEFPLKTQDILKKYGYL